MMPSMAQGGNPKVIGDYIVTQHIGTGSFANVWRATHRLTEKEVAIKDIATDRLNKKLQESLRSEISILKRANHPNIIKLYDIIEVQNRIYLVLEYCAGGDLAAYIQQCGRVPQRVARHFMQQLGTGIDESSIDISRRTSLMLPFWALTSMVSSNEAFASEEESGLGTSFLRNLGIGDMDIYYPKIFEGTWACYSTLISVDTPQGEDRADKKSVDFAKKQLGYTVEYQARFIPYKTHVIADRLFTTASLVESTVGKNVIDHGIWFPDKPNRISLILRGGVKVENTVTKRSFSLSAPNQFDSSEFSQQVFDNPRVQSGPPTIKASRNQTRYKWEPSTNQVSTIEAFQRVAMFPIPMEDGLSGFDIFNMDKPVTIYKYLVRFERVPS